MAKTYFLETDGTNLDAATINTYAMKQCVIQAQTTDRPGSPQVGMTIIETDFGTTGAGLKQYASATTGWVPPWNLPWGYIASAAVSTNQTGVGTALADLTSLTVTFTAVANRRYKVSAHCQLQQQTSAGNVELALIVAGTQLGQSLWVCATGDIVEPDMSVLPAVSAGSNTIKLQAKTSANTVNMNASSVNPAVLLVEDIGPNGAPT